MNSVTRAVAVRNDRDARRSRERGVRSPGRRRRSCPSGPLPATVEMIRVSRVDLAGRAGGACRRCRCRRSGPIATSLGMLSDAPVAGPPSPTGSSSSPARAVAGNRVNEAGRVVDHAHAVVQRVGDVDVAVRRRGDAARIVQRRLGRRAVVAIVAGLARAGDRRDDRRSA